MDEQELRKVLSANIRKGRMKADLSQIALAEKIKISANYLSNIERCKAWITPPTIIKLAKALEIEPHELFVSDKITYEEKDTIQAYAEENVKAVLDLFGKLKTHYPSNT